MVSTWVLVHTRSMATRNKINNSETKKQSDFFKCNGKPAAKGFFMSVKSYVDFFIGLVYQGKDIMFRFIIESIVA
jgi:hypothetical protein